jgi:hypothetical protein
LLNFLQKVAKIQQDLKAPKNQRNKFGNYNYRNCEDIFEAVKPLLGDLVLTVSDEIVVIQDRFYVKATAKITDGVSELTNCAYAREALAKKGMDESQISGSTSSYSRKYSLGGLFLIDDTKDADSDERDDKQEIKKQPIQVQKQMPIEQKDKQKQILALIEWLDPLVDKTKIESIKDFVIKQTQLELKAENFDEIIDRLEILKKERMS